MSEPTRGPEERREAGEVARLVSYVLLLVAAVLLYVEATGLPTSRWGVLGAGAFPKLVLGALAILALVAIVDSVGNLRAAGWPGFGWAVAWWLRARRLVIFLFVLLAFYLWAIPWLGFSIATFVFLLVAQALLAPRTWFAAGVGLVIALFFSFGMNWLFAEVFLVFLPRGAW